MIRDAPLLSVAGTGDGGGAVARLDYSAAGDPTGAGRVERVQDSLGGETVFTRDARGNVTVQTVKLNNTPDSAVTTTAYDALSRAITVIDPEDNSLVRHYRQRFYDSRGNLRRETAYQEAGATDVAKQTTVLAYDNAGRQTQQAVLRNAAGWATPPNVATDRVVGATYDADGRPLTRTTYNNGQSTPRITSTTYDALGRVDVVTDPSLSTADDNYAANGRLDNRVVNDGLGNRTCTFAYDGHDRVISQTAAGAGSDPDLVTGFEYDGLDRQVAVTAPKEVGDPKEIITRTGFDLVGRTIQVTENEGGAALERVTTFAYNRLNQLISRTAANKDSTGLPLANQVTTYRSDSLGRQTRIVYPDAPSGDHANPDTCTDCVKLVYDLAGRMSQRQDQRNTTVYAYDGRGLPRTRTTGTTVDTFDQDALGRTTLAQRGTAANPDAVSKSQTAYTDLGDLDYEDQNIAEGTTRRVDSGYDQAGNRLSLTYPGGTVLAYAPTALNQVDTVKVGVNPLVDYAYAGRKLQGRTTTTGAVGGTATYQQDWGYDSHRRINAITNSVNRGSGLETVADYAFTHDAVGNPRSQVTVTGLPDFLGDDRLFGVDDLNRLTGTDYLGSGKAESTSFDLVGNREAHQNRKGETTDYGVVNPANEFPWIGDAGHAVSYDATGNLTVDEEGRRYSYDEQNRLTEVKEPLPATGTLARYTYDALGRRIVFEDPIGGTTVRYYYDGVNPIEERDATDVLMRYHVHGGQYIDERVGTYDTGVGGLRAAGWSYYLLNDNFSIAGTGDGGGTIARLDYSATGDPTGAGAGYYFDADNNVTIDLIDWASLASCLLGPDVPSGAGCALHDFTRDGHVDLADAAVFQRYFNQSGAADLLPLSRSGNYAHDWDGDRDVDLDDFGAFFACVDTPPGDPLPPSCLAVHDFDNWGVSDGQVTGDLLFGDFGGFQHCFTVETWTPPTPADCFRAGPGGAAPTSGMFALHGQPVDVLADPDGPTGPQTALALQYSRARYFDLKHGRWLQRDPSGYTDGNNLYEAFRGNAVTNTDPSGEGILTWLFLGDYNQSDAAFVRHFGIGLKENTYGPLQERSYERFLLLYQAQQGGDPLFRTDADVFAGGLVLALGDVTPAGPFAEAGTGISTGRWEAPGVRIGGTARAVRGGAGVVETALFGLGSSTALQSSTAAALEVKVFTSTGGRLRLGLFSQGELLSLLESEAAAGNLTDQVTRTAATRIPGVPPTSEQLVFPFAEVEPAPWAATTTRELVIAPYGPLSQDTSILGQAHHLNQAAAYGDVIPFRQGMAIKLQGNIFTDVGAPHTMAHGSLESFWNVYRATRTVPTNLQYTHALQQSLRAAGLSEAQVQQALRAAIRERINYGTLGGMDVPRVPEPIRNLAR